MNIIKIAAFALFISSPAMAATTINSVPYTISLSGTYELSGNLSTGGNNNGITVAASDVVIDGKGYTISSSGSGSNTGLGIGGTGSNIKIKNIGISGFHGCIWLGDNNQSTLLSTSGKSNIVIDGVDLQNCKFRGIRLEARGQIIRNSTIVGVTGSTVYGNDYAFGIEAFGPGILIENNTIRNMIGGGSIGEGVAVSVTSHSEGFTIRNNQLINDAYNPRSSFGVWVGGSSGQQSSGVISGNYIENWETGVQHSTGNSALVDKNIFKGIAGSAYVGDTDWLMSNTVIEEPEDCEEPEPSGDPSDFLLHGNGSDASTTFTDSSAAPNTVTGTGNVQIDTAQSVFGGASILFDGTGDYLTSNNPDDFAFGTGDFTIDFRYRPNSTGLQFLYDGRPASTDGAYPALYFSSGSLTYFVNGANAIVGGSLSTATNYHIAITRASGTTRMFVNGVQVGSSYTDSTNYQNGSGRPIIGAYGYTAGSYGLNGWIDEFRVRKGTAAWTANFTPPSAEY